ncbi:MAG: futalosine hydrolase [Deltaproteobacteria bacterium]|nr:futalosine hydrolase [Deltaproteobacteria bacterium]
MIAATEAEVSRLTRGLEAMRCAGPWSAWQGVVGGTPVQILVTGVGKTNTALALGALVPVLRPAAVVQVGVGGAYPGSGLEPGHLAVATREAYGDEGAETRAGLRGLKALGLPVWRAEGREWYETLPVDLGLCRRLSAAARGVAPCREGGFVTVSTVTGTADRAVRLARRHRAVCESMEGAAAAHACLALGVPFGEVRGISNPVGPRDRRSWRLREAAAAAQEAVLVFLGS